MPGGVGGGESRGSSLSRLERRIYVINILQLTLNHINKGLPIEETDQVQDSYNLLPVWPKATEI